MEKLQMTQKELDDQMREITASMEAELLANEKQQIEIGSAIDSGRRLVACVQGCIAKDKELLRLSRIARTKILSSYKQKRFDLLNSTETLPTSSRFSDLTRPQLYNVQRMVSAALREELLRLGFPDAESGTVSFDLKADGQLSWRVFIPSDK